MRQIALWSSMNGAIAHFWARSKRRGFSPGAGRAPQGSDQLFHRFESASFHIFSHFFWDWKSPTKNRRSDFNFQRPISDRGDVWSQKKWGKRGKGAESNPWKLWSDRCGALRLRGSSPSACCEPKSASATRPYCQVVFWVNYACSTTVQFLHSWADQKRPRFCQKRQNSIKRALYSLCNENYFCGWCCIEQHMNARDLCLESSPKLSPKRRVQN